MAHTNTGIISAPVSFADVNAVLGTSHTDLATMCKDNNIKMWARYKPVVKNLISTIDQLDSNNQWKTTANWWKGTNNNCGITYNTYTKVVGTGSAISAIIGGLSIYSYTKPNGGSTSPYRLTDFNQYDHEAKPPATAVQASNAKLKAGSSLIISLATTPADGYNVRFEDIGGFDNYYYLAVVCDTSNNLIFVKSSTKKVGEYESGEMPTIEIPWNSTPDGGYDGDLIAGNTYRAYVILSSLYYVYTYSPQNASYVPLPTANGGGLSFATFECISESTPTLDVRIEAWVDNPGERFVHWKLTATSGYLPTSCSVQLVYSSTKQAVGSPINVTIPSQTTTYTAAPRETLSLPNTNYDLYMVKVSSGSLFGYAGISQVMPI